MESSHLDGKGRQNHTQTNKTNQPKMTYCKPLMSTKNIFVEASFLYNKMARTPSIPSISMNVYKPTFPIKKHKNKFPSGKKNACGIKETLIL